MAVRTRAVLRNVPYEIERIECRLEVDDSEVIVRRDRVFPAV